MARRFARTRPAVERVRVKHCGGMAVIDWLLSSPVALCIAGYAYVALIWWMLGMFSRVGDE